MAESADGGADANGSNGAGPRKASVVRKAALERAETGGASGGLYDAYAAKPAPAPAATPVPAGPVAAAPVRVKPAVPAPGGKAAEPVEADSWEDVADGSTPVLRTEAVHAEAPTDGSRQYSRDWLLSLRDKCQQQPDAATMAAILDADLLDRDGRPPAGIPSGMPRSGGGGGRGGGGPGGGGDDKWARGAAGGGTPTGPNRGPAGRGGGTPQGTPAEMASKWERGRMPPPLPDGGQEGRGGGGDRGRGDKRGGRGDTGFTPGGGYPAHLIPAHVRAAPVAPLHKAEAKYVIQRDDDADAKKQRAFKGILNKLTPQTFEKMVELTLELGITAAHHLEGFVDQLFSKALVEPTFCETYAMLCAALQTRLVEPSVDGSTPPKAVEFEKEDPGSETGVAKITFKRVLLNKCQEEFERGDARIREALEDPVAPGDAAAAGEDSAPREPGELTPEKAVVPVTSEARKAAEREDRVMKAKRVMFGNIRFIGELFKVRILSDKIMYSCVEKLLGDSNVTPDEESVEAVCKLMTTIGSLLEAGRVENKAMFNNYFVRFQQLSKDETLSSRHRFMLADLLEMRNNKWRARRKQEGPKKIDDVHRDAAMEAAQAERASFSGGRDRGGGGGGGDARRGGPGGRGGMEVFDRRGGGGPPPRGGPVDSGPPPAGPMRRGMEQDGGLTLGPRGGFASAASQGGGQRGAPPAPRGAPPAAPVPAPRLGAAATPAPRTGAPPPGLSAGPKAVPAPAAAPVKAPTPEPCMSEEELSASIKQVASYFADDGDVAAAEAAVVAWHMPPDGPEQLVVHLVMDGYDRKRYDWPSLARLLVQLSASSQVPPAAVLRGLRRLYDGLEDAACDLPAAPQRLGDLAGALVHAGRLAFSDVAHAIAEASPEGEPPGGLRSAGMALDALAAVLLGVSAAAKAAASADGSDEEGAEAAGVAAMSEVFKTAVAKSGLTLRAFADDDTAANARDEAALAEGVGLTALFPLAPVGAHLKAALQNGEPASEIIAWLDDRIPAASRSDPEYARLVVAAVLSRAAPPVSACTPAEVCANDGYGPLLRHVTAGRAAMRVGAVVGTQTVCQEANHPAGLAVALLEALAGCQAVDTGDITRWADDTKDTGPAKRSMLFSVTKWLVERREAEEQGDRSESEAAEGDEEEEAEDE